ncbi:GMC oxidoreductase [Cucurbitaria berberidis CBS 394.84]|uniref:GMC oxidoreductase n=1 Tax=Cucurbitaria berberidis CBS 394.84 TaxID=1168544 RepID=A0A9P4L8I5_9PLEO|nr:GMC oxidoreductase [Cucurbitaria berberidis CBS 394.84]KAF1846126.1 GMC oxidoreductase [Cucurbitaria berberidis CBS 394.84]
MSLERVDSIDPAEVYDYIICGGGTSGCVVAGRLAEDPNVKVLVLEAGPDNKDLENVHMVGGWNKNLEGETDWNIITEPIEQLDNRQVKASRGRFLGGSSGVNGTLCIRGTKQDYDDWGLDEWTGDKMFEYMKKAETFHEKDWHKADKSAHGTNGPLHTEPHDLAPISERVKESMIEQGLPYHPDMFTTGKISTGCGDALRTVHQGIRSTAADFITKGSKRNNITIKTEVTVDKLLLSRDAGELTARGVATISKSGKKVEYQARKEVIVSAGAYCSPPILMRSGLGPREQLEKHGIECLVDLPGVGQNLMDHVLCFIFYEVSQPALTNDYLAYHDNAIASTYQLYKEKKTGMLSTFPFGIFGFTRLDERLKDSELWQNAKREPGRDPMGLTKDQPNIEFWNTELYGGPAQYNDFPVDHKHTFAFCTLLFNQHSRGSVVLKSTDPLENPIVDHNYLDHPLDMLVLTEACRFANEIVMNGKGTKDVIKGSWPANLTHHTFTKQGDWEPYVRKHATTCYHASGTCKMGPPDDKNAVLDSRLRVRGVRNLRVADVSSVPIVNNGHTQMVAYGIGEGAAELIKEDALNSVSKLTPKLEGIAI